MSHAGTPVLKLLHCFYFQPAAGGGETAADSTSSCAYQIGENDEYCDDDNNNIGCNWDGGACCGDNVKKKYCYYCECLDPDFQGKILYTQHNISFIKLGPE